MEPILLNSTELNTYLPDKYRGKLTVDIMSHINNTIGDSEIGEYYKDNLISYSTVLQDTRYSIANYVNAIKYLTYLGMGHTGSRAWQMTFPAKADKLRKEGKSANTIAAHASSYKQGGLVVRLLTQAMMPVHLVNQKNFQDAIDVEVRLMHTAKSEMVRQQAAKTILEVVKPPEIVQMEVQHKLDDAGKSALSSLRDMLNDIANKEVKAIADGKRNASDVLDSMYERKDDE